MKLTENQLRRDLRAAIAEDLDRYPPAAGAEHGDDPAKPRRMLTVTAVLLALLVAGGIGAWQLLGGTEPSTTVGVEPADHPDVAPTPSDDDTTLEDAIRVAGSGPLSPRQGSSLVLSDDRLYVLGGLVEGPNRGLPDLGFASPDDGAVLDLDTATWTPLPPPPIGQNSYSDTATMTDDRVAYFRGTRGALLDTQTLEWQHLPEAPRPVGPLAALDGDLIAIAARASLDLDTGRWERWPAPPIEHMGPGRPQGVVVGGDVVYAFETERNLDTAQLTVASLNPDSRTWTVRGTIDLDHAPVTMHVASNGEAMLIVSTQLDDRVLFEPDRTPPWRPRVFRWTEEHGPPVEVPFEEMPFTYDESISSRGFDVEVVGDDFIVWPHGSRAALLEGTTWRHPVPAPPPFLGRTSRVDELIAFGFTDEPRNELLHFSYAPGATPEAGGD